MFFGFAGMAPKAHVGVGALQRDPTKAIEQAHAQTTSEGRNTKIRHATPNERHRFKHGKQTPAKRTKKRIAITTAVIIHTSRWIISVSMCSTSLPRLTEQHEFEFDAHLLHLKH